VVVLDIAMKQCSLGHIQGTFKAVLMGSHASSKGGQKWKECNYS